MKSLECLLEVSRRQSAAWRMLGVSRQSHEALTSAKAAKYRQSSMLARKVDVDAGGISVKVPRLTLGVSGGQPLCYLSREACGMGCKIQYGNLMVGSSVAD